MRMIKRTQKIPNVTPIAMLMTTKMLTKKRGPLGFPLIMGACNSKTLRSKGGTWVLWELYKIIKLCCSQQFTSHQLVIQSQTCEQHNSISAGWNIISNGIYTHVTLWHVFVLVPILWQSYNPIVKRLLDHIICNFHVCLRLTGIFHWLPKDH